jgi:hypothetical protein
MAVLCGEAPKAAPPVGCALPNWLAAPPPVGRELPIWLAAPPLGAMGAACQPPVEGAGAGRMPPPGGIVAAGGDGGGVVACQPPPAGAGEAG